MTQPSERDLKWVGHLSKEYLYCRSLRHAWNPQSFKALDPDEVYQNKPAEITQIIKRDLVCLRCDTIRQDYFGRSGGSEPFSRIRVRYGYPRDYQFQTALHDKERPEHIDYQVEMYNRF